MDCQMTDKEKENLSICEFYAGYVKSDELQKAKQHLTYDKIIDNSFSFQFNNEDDRQKGIDVAPVPCKYIKEYGCYSTELSKENSVSYRNYEEKWNKIIRVKPFESGFTFYQYAFDDNEATLGTIFTYRDCALYGKGKKAKYFFYYDEKNKTVLSFSKHFFDRFNQRFLCMEFNAIENSKEIIRNFLKISKKQNYIYYKDAVYGDYKSDNDANIIDCDGIYLGKIYHNLNDKIQHMVIFRTCISNFSLYDWQNKLKNALPLSENKVLFNYNLRDL